MKVQILGSGCPTCKKFYEITQQIVAQLDNQNIELEYLTGIEGTSRIIELGAMSSPILVVDNKIALAGFTSDESKIKAAIINTSQEKK